MKGIGYFFGGFLVIVFVGWLLGWFGKGAEVTSANHVEQQWADAYSNYSSLTQVANNICTARKVVAAETDPGIRAQRQSQAIAQEQNFNRIAAQYNAAMANAFQAKYVKPGDLPRTAPSLEDALRDAGCGA